MRPLLTIMLLGAILVACKKEKTYFSFTPKQLDFVNYTQGQPLKFTDTTHTVQNLAQDYYHRAFREQIGLYGKTGAFREEYEVFYSAAIPGAIDLWVNVQAKSSHPLNIRFAGYQTLARPDSLPYTHTAITINGVNYRDVYTVKMYKNGQFINNTDTATLFHNRQYGVVQLLFPSGKSIVRMD